MTRATAEPSAAGPDVLHPGFSRMQPERPQPEIAAAPVPKMLTLLLAAGVFLCSFHLFRVGEINLTFGDVTFSLAFIGLAASGRLEPYPFAQLTPLWLMCLVAMLGGLFVSSLANGDMLRWAIVSAQYLFSYLALPMVLLGLSQDVLRRLVLVLIASVTLIEAVGIAAYYLIADATEVLGHDFLSGAGRLGSFVGEANWNGAVIAMTMPFVIYAVRIGLLGPMKGLVAGSLLFWGVMLSGSFTAFSATAIAAAISMLVGRSLPSARVIAAIGTIALVLVASGYRPPAIFEKRVAPALASGSLDSAGTFSGRVELIEEAWAKSGDTMILGLGADGYRKFSAHNQPVHNMYLLIWLEGGFLALVAWIVMMIVLLIVPLSMLRWHRLESALSLSVMGVFLINTMANAHMYHRLLILPVLLSIGVALRANTPVLLQEDYPDGDQPQFRLGTGA